MRVIGHVAVNVFKESVRDRVLYNLVVFGALLIGASYLIGQLTAGQDVKIIKDLGLAAIATFGLLIAVFIGIGLVWKEVERRSIYALLSKPVRRHEFVLGKYAGLALTLLVNVAIMTVAFYAVLAYLSTQFPASQAIDPRMLLAIGLIFLELLLVTAIALFFSTFSGPFLSAALTLRTLGDRALQRRSAQFRERCGIENGRVPGTRPLLRAAELCRLRREGTGGSRFADPLVLFGRDRGLRCRLHSASADRRPSSCSPEGISSDLPSSDAVARGCPHSGPDGRRGRDFNSCLNATVVVPPQLPRICCTCGPLKR